MNITTVNTQAFNIEYVSFSPFPGLTSPDLQTILGSFSRSSPFSHSVVVQIPVSYGDVLFCEKSIPHTWKESDRTVVMIHGLGGSSSSSYMTRIGRKLYDAGHQVVRVNLRGCKDGVGKSRLPYHGGVSADIVQVLHHLKKTTPLSEIIVLGFSLGGNITLKLAAELQDTASNLISHAIAVCPAFDLGHAVTLISRRTMYERYYVKRLCEQARQWIGNKSISSLREFDSTVTAPLWGYSCAQDYYTENSSVSMLSQITIPTYILFSQDDPFIDYQPLLHMKIPSSLKIFLTQYGGHMGFLGWPNKSHGIYWMDKFLHNLVTTLSCDSKN